MVQEVQNNLFTKSQVLLYDGQNDSRVWIVIKSSVYDVTAYLETHPGGKELIMEYAGKDATKAFNDSGHSSYAQKQLALFKIGELAQEKETNDNNVRRNSTKIERTGCSRFFRKIFAG